MGGCLSSCPDAHHHHNNNNSGSGTGGGTGGGDPHRSSGLAVARAPSSSHETSTVPVRIVDGRIYHDDPMSRYLLPRDEMEADRLHEQHFVTKELLGCNILAETFQHIDFNHQSIHVLDVGCGPATWLCETSLEYSHCQFKGIDISDLWPKDIRPVNLDFRQANVLRGIPFPDASFDFVQLRFMVLSFTADEWPRVLAEIRRVLKPGGCLQCIDLDMRITTDDLNTRMCLDSFEQLYKTQGLDSATGAKLDMRLTDGGYHIIQSEYREVPLGAWGGRVGTASLHMFLGSLDGMAPWLKRYLEVSDENYNYIRRQIELGLNQSNAFMGLHAFLAQKPLE